MTEQPDHYVPTAHMVPICPNCYQGCLESKHGWDHNCQEEVLIPAEPALIVSKCWCVCYEAA